MNCWECDAAGRGRHTFHPLVYRVFGGGCEVRVRIFPPDFHGILLVDHHHVRHGAGAPAVAADSRVAVHVGE